ncbi:MAG: tyrosine-type recombinase/integrase [Chloroflexi bacterium]|nr:tyrosine-type recombinase/integrase [Chloroflexota bacterium]MBV9601346.1 tyrosine-type recombinase/integrase [Chloroflexota bacterium]
MYVVKEREGRIVRRVHLFGDNDQPIAAVTRFLDHLAERGYSPYTLAAYAYDLQNLFVFLAAVGLEWHAFRPADALRFLAFLRRRATRGPAQRLGLALIIDGETPGRRLSAPTVNRILAGVASFYEWAIAAEAYSGAESPLQLREDPALARVADRHQPFMGRASRQRPVRRVVAVKQPLRLPRPMASTDVEALLSGLTRLRDLAIFLLMVDGGLRPGEVLSLHLEDVAYGQRRVAIRQRDDHPRGLRGKSRAERVVDLHEPRTLNAVSQYVLHERPREALHPFLFMVGGKGARRLEPLGYDAVVRLFARHLQRLGLRSPEKTPHALRHTHATAMWEGGMRELSLQKRLGHASPESTKIYTRVSDEQVLADYTRALEAQR